MNNLCAISDFRKICPVNSVVDDALIAAAINHSQVELVPAVTSRKYFFDLITALDNDSLTEVQKGFLRMLQPALACFAAYHLVDIAGNQIHPTQISDAMPAGSKSDLRKYYMNQTSSYLHQVYVYCDENNIEHNKFCSTEFCGVVLGGNYSV